MITSYWERGSGLRHSCGQCSWNETALRAIVRAEKRTAGRSKGLLLPRSTAGGVDCRLAKNATRPGVAHDADREAGLIVRDIGVEVTHRQTRSRAMSIAT